MSLKIKILISISIVSLLAVIAGVFYYKSVSNFDNKKQYMLAEKLYKEQNYQEAYAAFLKIKPFSKYKNISVLKQGIAAEKLGDWVIAEKKYSKYLKKDAKNSFSAKAEYSLAKAYYMNKKFDKAAKLFLKIKKQSVIEDYQFAADYYLGKISLEKELTEAAKKYYLAYIKNVPTGTYALNIAFDMAKFNLEKDEPIITAKIFLANQKYDEALSVLQKVPDAKAWTYKAISEYYKNNIENYKKLVQDGYAKNCKDINKEDLKNFTDFYLSMQKDAEKTLSELQKTSANSVIPDYFEFKKAQFLPTDKKIEAYKQIIKKYPRSEYISECLYSVFFDFGNKRQYNSAVRVAEIYLQKFPDTKDIPQILFWTGKYLLKLKRQEDANVYFEKLKKEYPSSYYSYRASKINDNQALSWFFTKTSLPENISAVNFPIETVNEYDKSIINLFLEAEDTTVFEEIPFNNTAIKSWVEYQKGNIQKSIYLANKYITDSKQTIPYSVSVWKLAFPVYYSEDINLNSSMRNLDAFLILSLIREESHFNPQARSSSNAVGLMQLMMSTAEDTAEKFGLEPPTDIKLQNPKYNISLGTAYFSQVLELTNNLPMFAIGGYNGGPNAMNKWREKHKDLDFDEFVEKIPYEESKQYIKKVYRSRYNYFKIYEE